MTSAFRRGAAFGCALFLCLGACSGQPRPSSDGWRLQRTGEGVTIVADASYEDCLVAINSVDGGYRRAGSVAFPAGDSVSFRPGEFTNSAGRSPGVIDDVLVQCFAPPRVVVLP